MARRDRTGNRKTREQRIVRRVPEMGYYLIVTDTEATESNFFNGLKADLPEDSKGKLVIKVTETKTQNLIQKCQQLVAYEVQYRIPWIVFDRDRVPNFDQIIKEAENKGINVGWSNPCFEIWMFAYFGRMPNISESWTCCARFGKLYKKETRQDYSKADIHLYKRLYDHGDEKKAIEIAVRKYEQHLRENKTDPSQMCPATTVHKLVSEIRGKVHNL